MWTQSGRIAAISLFLKEAVRDDFVGIIGKLWKRVEVRRFFNLPLGLAIIRVGLGKSASDRSVRPCPPLCLFGF